MNESKPAPAEAAAAQRPVAASEKKSEPARREMRFGSYPIFIVFWPLIPAGEILARLQEFGWVGAETLAWVYLTILSLCFVAAGFDVGRNLAVGWVLFVLLCWVGGLYLRDTQDFPVLGTVRDYLASFDAQYSPGFGRAVSLLVLVGFLGMQFNVFLNHRWRITPNEMHQFRRGEMEDAITRGAKRIVVEFPDVFEMLLCGAGHVVAKDSKGREEIRRIPRVPFLLFRRGTLDRIAEAWAITNVVDAGIHEEDEV